MSDAAGQTEGKSALSETRKGFVRSGLAAMLTNQGPVGWLLPIHLKQLLTCVLARGRVRGSRDYQSCNTLKAHLRSVLVQAGTCNSMERECYPTRLFC